MTTPATPSPAHPDPATFTARTPEDVLALVPVVLGFTPQDSVAMLTFGARRPFHARVDLPTGSADLAEMTEALLAPSRQHHVRRVLFVVYTDSGPLARRAARCLVGAFEDAGIDVVEALRTDGRCWWPAARSPWPVPPS